MKPVSGEEDHSTILLAHTRIFTRLILILKATHNFLGNGLFILMRSLLRSCFGGQRLSSFCHIKQLLTCFEQRFEKLLEALREISSNL